MFPDLSVGCESSTTADDAQAEVARVVEFWQEAGPDLWFAKDAEFDCLFHARFLSWHEKAARDELTSWRHSPCGALALLVLLDQFPRNAFRGTPRMYATDHLARAEAEMAVAAGHDQRVEKDLRVFFYLPFAHSEDWRDQERSVDLVRHLGEPDLSHARRHRDIIGRFGRFPHRNPILGRAMTDEEQRYLNGGGYAG